MTVSTFQINRYLVYMYSRVLMQKEIMARLTCYGTQGYSIYVYFVKPGVALKPSETVGKVGRLYYPFSSLPYFIDLLRNEAPIIGFLDDSDPARNHIRTGTEDVGEGEIDA